MIDGTLHGGAGARFDLEKVLAVWAAAPGLCAGQLVQIDAESRVVGCAVGSLLWATGRYAEEELHAKAMHPGLEPGERGADAAIALLRDEYGLPQHRIPSLIAWNERFEAPPKPANVTAARRDYMVELVRGKWAPR